MQAVNPFKGKVNFYDGDNKRKKLCSLNFDVSPQVPSMGETLMCKFEDLKFTEEEKRELTAKHREIICEYRTIDKKIINRESKQILKLIKNSKSDSVTIVASDLGAYICLAAIFSGKIPKNKEVKFELETVPLKLFPSELVKDKMAGQNYPVSIKIDRESWLRPFKSLYTCPNYMLFQNEFDCTANYDFDAA